MGSTSALDIDLLRSFVLIAEEGSFTRAAERVGRTQSAVSQQIRRLESLVGHRLLERGSGAGAPLTPQGGFLPTPAPKTVFPQRRYRRVHAWFVSRCGGSAQSGGTAIRATLLSPKALCCGASVPEPHGRSSRRILRRGRRERDRQRALASRVDCGYCAPFKA